jgi:CspA family cold shock protein
LQRAKYQWLRQELETKGKNGRAGRPPIFFRLHPDEDIQAAGGVMRFAGKVKWFNESKGYGFIEREDGTDVFVHYTNIVGKGFRTLKENEEVEFEVNEGPKGLQAVNVEKV